MFCITVVVAAGHRLVHAHYPKYLHLRGLTPFSRVLDPESLHTWVMTRRSMDEVSTFLYFHPFMRVPEFLRGPVLPETRETW